MVLVRAEFLSTLLHAAQQTAIICRLVHILSLEARLPMAVSVPVLPMQNGYMRTAMVPPFIFSKEIEIAALRIMSTMSAYMSALGKEKRSVNTGMLAGNGTIRASVKGYASGKLSKEELHQVWKAVEEALSAGALGISLGIAYAPEFEYDRDGLVEALQPLKGTDIPITTHIRNEGDGILLALQEVISVAEELQIPLHVSHMKCIGRKNWGGTPVKILKLFDQAAERGVKVDFDLYPYLTGSTQLVHLLPSQFQEGGTDAICARLADPFCRKEITKVLKQPSEKLFYKKKNGKYQLDLWEANHIIFLKAGIKEEHISMPGICTCCNPEFLFSHRASHGRRGNLAAFLGIRREK